MPRPSYDEHRARKAAFHALQRRRGSVVESETDLESLASQSTYLSNSSYISNNPAQRLNYPYQHQLYPPGLRARTLSSTSQGSFSTFPPSPLYTSGGTGKQSVPRSDGVRDEAKEKERKERHERRAKRREERSKRSTLNGDQFDSPLRRWLRWMTRLGMGQWSLQVVLTVWILSKAAVLLWDHRMPLRSAFVGESSNPRMSARSHLQRLAIPLPSVLDAPLDFAPLADTIRIVQAVASSPLGQVLRSLLGDVLLALGVIMFVQQAVKKSGRSARSLITAITTVLFSPVFFLRSFRSAPSYNPSQAGSIACAITALMRGNNLLAALSLGIDHSASFQAWAYLLICSSYILGVGIWRGGVEGLRISPIFGVAWAVASRSLSMESSVPDILRFWVDLSWSQLAAICTAVIPGMVALLYTSFTSRPNRSKVKIVTSDQIQIPPFATMLPFALFTSTILRQAVLPEDGELTVALLPVLLAGSLRAEKDATGSSDEEVYGMAVFLSNVSALSSQSASLHDKTFYFGAALLWNILIGNNPFASPTVTRRRQSRILLFLVVLVSIDLAFSAYLPHVQHQNLLSLRTTHNMAKYAQDWTLRGIFVFSWLWGLRKMLQSGWAIIGFG